MTLIALLTVVHFGQGLPPFYMPSAGTGKSEMTYSSHVWLGNPGHRPGLHMAFTCLVSAFSQGGLGVVGLCMGHSGDANSRSCWSLRFIPETGTVISHQTLLAKRK